MSELPEAHEPPPSGCGPRVAAVLIVFFVNVPLVSVGWGRLWRTAPMLLVVALVVDVFLVLLLALWWWRRRPARLAPISDLPADRDGPDRP